MDFDTPAAGVGSTPEEIIEQLEAYRAEVDEEVEEALKTKELKSPKQRKPTSEEIKEVKEAVADLIKLGVYPKVTVDRDHLEAILKDGLRERETAYQKGVKLIVGTLGTEPFLPEGQDRVILELHVSPDDVTPRFTGPANRFDGIVAIGKEVVPPDQITVIEEKNEKKAS